jgi:nitrous oxidase accessory protein
VGDLPYRETSLFENLMEREPKLRLFLHSPAQQAIDMAARAFPIIEPQYRVCDDAPLMQPPPRERSGATLAASPAGRGMWPTASALLLAALAMLGAARRPFAPTSHRKGARS